MLAVQVQYLNYLEGKRHNEAVENENVRHNVKTEQQGDVSLSLTSQGLAETKRHNIVNEQLSQSSLDETIRHNKSTESIQRTQANASMLSASAAMKNAETNLQRQNFTEQQWNEIGRNTAIEQKNLIHWQQMKAEKDYNWTDWKTVSTIVNDIIPF